MTPHTVGLSWVLPHHDGVEMEEVLGYLVSYSVDGQVRLPSGAGGCGQSCASVALACWFF